MQLIQANFPTEYRWENPDHGSGSTTRKHIHNVVSLDQTGFIPGPQLYTNIRCLLNIIYSRVQRSARSCGFVERKEGF